MARYAFVSGGRRKAGLKLQALLRRKKYLEEKRISAIEKAYENPSYHKKLSSIAKTRYRSPRKRDELSRNLHKFWTPPQRKTESLRKKKMYREFPYIRKKIDKGITEWWREHPNLREVYRRRAIEYFLENPAKFKKFMRGGRNASKLKYKTKQGFLVRSSGELKIANFLFERKIKSQYESRTLNLEGHLCTPDFFLLKFRIFIEFYGGHPGSWKKKVLKNKLYKKHHIKCIFLTPGELQDLDYYLVDEIKKVSS